MKLAWRNFIRGLIELPKKIWQEAINFFVRKNPKPNANLDKELVLRVKHPHRLPSLGQFLYLPRIIKKWEKIILAAASLIFLVALIIITGNFILTHRALLPRSGGDYVEAIVGNPKLINPLWANANDVDRDLTNLIFAGLFTYNKDLEIAPDLASGYEISDDGKTYTIHLKPNLFWQDKEPLTASDIVFTITSIQNPAMKSPLATNFRGVTTAAPDDQTVVFNLEAPSALFLDQLTIGIIPEHLWSDVPAENARLAELNIKPIGAGPFRFKSLKKSKTGALYSYTLESNPYHYGQKPYLTTFTFKFFSDYESAIDALDRGNTDGLGFIPYDLRNKITNKKIVFYNLNLPQITALFFNQRKNPVLAEKQVREALAAAIDKNSILNDGFHGSGSLVDGPALPQTIGFTSDVTKYDFNVQRAGELLNQDGWKLEDGKSVRVFNPTSRNDRRFIANSSLHLSLATVNVPEYVKSAELIRDSWQKIGVEVELVVSEPSKIERDIITPRAYDILLYGEILGTNPDPYSFWHSSQVAAPGVNLAGYANRRVDALLEEARIMSDPTERARRFDEFQKTVTAELPAVFLVSPSYDYAINQKIHGVEINRLGNPADRFLGINNWYIKTRSQIKWSQTQ